MTIKFYDLSQPFYAGIPLWPWPVMYDVEVGRVTFPEYATFPGDPKRGRVNKMTTVIKTKFHASTHMDAPLHVLENGMTIDAIPLSSCYGEGVVVDMRYLKKWDVIGAKDLDNAKPEIKKGDFVVVNTGWHKYFPKQGYVFFNHFPGFYTEAADWFVEHEVKAVAIDGGACDHPLAHTPLKKWAPNLWEEYMQETGKDADEEFPIYEPCHLALAKAGIPGIEIAGGQIDEVTGKRCTLACFPIRYQGGEASLVRLVAIVEE
ncbi:cyclase family protein [Chloroflexota bacterium]